MHIQHPVLRPDKVEFRGYQVNLARVASKHDTLVVLPTGMGKTIVAVLVLADALRDGARRVLVMAPTKPLVEQHAAFFESVLHDPWKGRVRVLTGHTPPARRGEHYAEDGILCATPQVIQNDIVAGRLDAAGLDWVVFDEAHRGVGEYAYTFIGQELRRAERAGRAAAGHTGGASGAIPGAARRIRRLGLTASPGHDVQKIDEVRQQLGLPHVEIRTPADADVAPYLHELDVEWETLPLPANMARVSRRLQDALADRVQVLRKEGWLKSARSRPSRKTLLETARLLQARARDRADTPPEVYGALSLQAQAMKLLHAIELAETQGAAPFRGFVEQLKAEARGAKPSKATLSLLHDARVTEAYEIARFDVQENPKLGRTETLVKEQLEADADSRTIVFANYRSTCDAVAEHIGRIPGVRPTVFVGQGKRRGREGLSQKKQQEVLGAFRAGTFNVLVATSVAEEGLDIPDTDLVVFYEPIPSEIRSIQRRGRTGRSRRGRVLVLMTKGTQDEAAHWTARRKEQQMVQELQGLRTRLAGTPGAAAGKGPHHATRPARAAAAQSTLEASRPSVPPPAGPRITCDQREQPGGVVRHLHALGVHIDVKSLDVGDFVLSDRVAVERKTAADFVDSLLDHRLFDQLKALQVYPKPFLIVEGDSLHGHRNVSPEALHGALASITVDLGVPVVQTKDPLETARFLAAVAKREQTRAGRRIAIRPGRTAMPDDQRLRHILAGFPRVDEARAEALLSHFGSLRAVLAASPAELAEVEGVGRVIAADLHRLLDAAYRDVFAAEPSAEPAAEPETESAAGPTA